jgi:hypothetical protein
MKQWAQAVAGLAGLIGDGAWRQIGRGTWETRRGGGGDAANAVRGDITSAAAPGWESDRPIGAGKRLITVERRGLNVNRFE